MDGKYCIPRQEKLVSEFYYSNQLSPRKITLIVDHD
jgi:hypothetical protein